MYTRETYLSHKVVIAVTIEIRTVLIEFERGGRRVANVNNFGVVESHHGGQETRIRTANRHDRTVVRRCLVVDSTSKLDLHVSNEKNPIGKGLFGREIEVEIPIRYIVANGLRMTVESMFRLKDKGTKVFRHLLGYKRIENVSNRALASDDDKDGVPRPGKVSVRYKVGVRPCLVILRIKVVDKLLIEVSGLIKSLIFSLIFSSMALQRNHDEDADGNGVDLKPTS